jgi:hypothetical protein
MVVLLLIVSVGGHWAIVQSVAWVTMFARFSQSMSLAQAAAYTFDGQHPCALCCAVKEGKKAERKESQVKPPEKMTFSLSPEPPFLPAPPPASAFFAAGFALRSFLDEPPHPPPRAA